MKNRTLMTVLAIGSTLVFVSLGIGIYLFSKGPVQTNSIDVIDDDEKDERQEPSIFRNTATGVKYVGDAACAACHAKVCNTYHQHPMGLANTTLNGSTVHDHLPASGNPFEVNGVRYRVERRGSQLIHLEEAVDPRSQVVVRTESPVQYAIGSGSHAVSYLIERDGQVTQSPVTWYAENNSFRLSPAFQPLRDRFERSILPGCLFCHANQVQHVSDSLQTYQKPLFPSDAIGCERCHGPSELHVSERTKTRHINGIDDTIVNPAVLPAALRDDICNQCHLGGKERVLRRGKEPFDYRPGLPLKEFWRVFVVPTTAVSNMRVASHVEQINVSRCSIASRGEMSCTTCHDPHVQPKPDEKTNLFRKQCLQCHETKGCTEPLPKRLEFSKTDDCTACHMPKAKTLSTHVALTDHRIPRRMMNEIVPELDPIAVSRQLVPYGKSKLNLNNAELLRDLAVGLMMRARNLPDTFRIEMARTWLPVLERAVNDHPDDLSAHEGLIFALQYADQWKRALGACETALKIAPNRELILSDAGVTAQKLGMNDRSLAYWQRALAINPHSSRNRFEVANALSVQGDWSKAVAECQRVLSQNAGHVPSRLLMMQYYWTSGNKEKAKAEWIAIQALHPPNEAQLRQQFDGLFR